MGYVRVIKHWTDTWVSTCFRIPQECCWISTYNICIHMCTYIYIIIYTHTYMYNWLYVYNINIYQAWKKIKSSNESLPTCDDLHQSPRWREKTSPHSWLVRSWLRPSLGGNGMSVSRVGSLFWVVAIRGSRRRKRGRRRSRRRRENILVVWKEYTAVNKYFPTPASNEIHLSIYRSCISGWNMIRPK